MPIPDQVESRKSDEQWYDGVVLNHRDGCEECERTRDIEASAHEREFRFEFTEDVVKHGSGQEVEQAEPKFPDDHVVAQQQRWHEQVVDSGRSHGRIIGVSIEKVSTHNGLCSITEQVEI